MCTLNIKIKNKNELQNKDARENIEIIIPLIRINFVGRSDNYGIMICLYNIIICIKKFMSSTLLKRKYIFFHSKTLDTIRIYPHFNIKKSEYFVIYRKF